MTPAIRSLPVLVLLAAALPLRADDPKIQADVVYGHKDGMALTFDVYRPEKPNGAAVLFVQSGGWYSIWADPKKALPNAVPFTTKGYTMFVVRHGSAPKYAVPDAVADMRRSVRYIRLHAKDWGIDPDRIGVMGGSAGGHLTLMLATTADDGDPNAEDEVLRQSDRIAAAVALFPPTDLRGWTTDPPAEIKKHAGLKPPLTFDAAKEPEVSPLLHVTPKTAPVLLIHGDKDALVPLEHSTKIMTALEAAKVPSKLVVIEGAGHGFDPKQTQTQVTPALMEWFDKHLAAKKEP